VDIVDVKANPIETFTEDGIRTADGKERKFDLVVLATGFDAISGGVTQIDIRGEDGTSIKDKWSQGTRTHLGLASRNYPNMFIVYGPQAPTAFVTGGYNAQVQGKWVGDCLSYLRDHEYNKIQPTAEAEEAWRKHVEEVGKMGLFSETESWYFGKHPAGKNTFVASVDPLYRQQHPR
jgi:cation diffusion facilitator CzcD-associated flavoprotein CzcO